MPRRCVIYIPLMLYDHWCIMSLMVNDGISEYVKHIGVGLCVARFWHSGLPEPLTVERATVQGFTLFLSCRKRICYLRHL